MQNLFHLLSKKAAAKKQFSDGTLFLTFNFFAAAC